MLQNLTIVYKYMQYIEIFDKINGKCYNILCKINTRRELKMKDKIKLFIDDIKENFFGDLLFLTAGAIVGYAIKILVR